MIVVSSPKAMARLAAGWKRKGLSVGFVPTMGALHQGHGVLVKKSAQRNERTVVSVFVNPLQFGPKEDFGRYPRTLAADKKACAAWGADVLYHPTPQAMYPEGFRTTVEVQGFSDILDGAFRPGHFKGVATVVLKLLLTVQANRAYFGEKDFQQLVIIRRMAKNLDLSTQIVGIPTVREKDGLALSSRNRYLSPEERAQAPKFAAALRLGVTLAKKDLSPAAVLSRVKREILKIQNTTIDYVEWAEEDTLKRPPVLRGRLRLLAAIRLGKTRLIDNVKVVIPAKAGI